MHQLNGRSAACLLEQTSPRSRTCLACRGELPIAIVARPDSSHAGHLISRARRHITTLSRRSRITKVRGTIPESRDRLTACYLSFVAHRSYTPYTPYTAVQTQQHQVILAVTASTSGTCEVRMWIGRIYLGGFKACLAGWCTTRSLGREILNWTERIPIP